MDKRLLFALLLAPTLASAQTVPPPFTTQGAVPTITQWSNAWSGKLDAPLTAGTTPTSGFSVFTPPAIPAGGGPLMFSDGSKVQAANTGIYRGANSDLFYNPNYGGQIVFSLNKNSYTYGTDAMLTFPAANGVAWWIDNADDTHFDISLMRDGAGKLAQRSGTIAQSYRVYNTYTDANNGEWGGFDWQTTPNALTIGTQKNGTGAVRGTIVTGGNANIDFGATTIGWLIVHAGGGFMPELNNWITLGDATHQWNQVFANSYVSGASTGVSCSGAPTASFAVTNGIVTHC